MMGIMINAPVGKNGISMKKYNKSRIRAYLKIAFLISLGLIGLFFIIEKQISQSNKFQDERMLTISAKECNESTVIAIDEPDNKYSNYIYCSGLTEVTVQICNKTIALEDAIQSGQISLAEIFAYARIDAISGICKETFETENGLTEFTYQYPEYKIKLIYDVYETPDGKSHLISYAHLLKLRIFSEFPNFTADNNVPWQYIDREDWGLTLDVASASSSGLNIRTTQSGGQQIGYLRITKLRSIYDADSLETIIPIKEASREDNNLQQDIAMGGDGTLSLDWTELYGELPSGSYIIRIEISDIYEQAQMHPLMNNYYDVQTYELTFTIP